VSDAGGRIWLDADIRIGYVPRGAPGALWRQYWNYGRGRARMLVKHKARPAARQMIPVVNLALLAASALAAPFQPVGALVWPLAYASLLAGASLFVAVRERTFCGLAAGPALAIMHVAWAIGFVAASLSRAPASRAD
jgi:succinoglycan biosynthesis protein ExoA